jgi:hypothetical protein
LVWDDARKKQIQMKILQLPNPGNNGRLGNQLFTIASTIALALRHGYTPRFPADWKYRDVFNIPAEWFGEMEPLPGYKERCYEYDESLDFAFDTDNHDSSLSGYLQSPKYWEGYEAEIRQYLTPKGCNPGSRDAVGIHYRRGDYVGNPNYVQLGDDYYTEAFEIINDWIKPSVARSDDAAYIAQEWDGQICGTELQDFISLAECKEHIISNSTYSWWAAYLSGGKVVAPKEWFAGKLAKRCSTKDLLPENWILI